MQPNKEAKTYLSCRNEFCDILTKIGKKYGVSTAFKDFCVFTACAISNSIDRHHFEDREQRYMELIKKYSREEITEGMVSLFSLLVEALERKRTDFLGEVFSLLNLGNDYTGQVFTPYHIGKLLAEVTLQNVEEKIHGGEIVILYDPCIGSGCLTIAAAEAFISKGGSLHTQLHVTGTDVDESVLLMAYTQLSLLGISAVLIHGDALTGKNYSYWITPFHVIYGWDHRLETKRQATNPNIDAVDTSQTVTFEEAEEQGADEINNHIAFVKNKMTTMNQIALF